MTAETVNEKAQRYLHEGRMHVFEVGGDNDELVDKLMDDLEAIEDQLTHEEFWKRANEIDAMGGPVTHVHASVDTYRVTLDHEHWSCSCGTETCDHIQVVAGIIAITEGPA